VIKYKNVEDFSSFQIPLSIDVDSSESTNASLSRALKRKFTELEEITQRLKTRLFDVCGDENVDPDDEFERDLNTEAAEDDDWPAQIAGTSQSDHFMNRAEEFELERFKNNLNGALTLTTNTCSYASSVANITEVPFDRNVSGHSEMTLESLVKAHDIDTIINPHIIKNLINPLIAASSTTDSSPRHEQLSAGSSSTAEKIQTIESALEKASISDSESNERQAPDGGMISDDVQ
jgi:C2 domain-containing protein 3